MRQEGREEILLLFAPLPVSPLLFLLSLSSCPDSIYSVPSPLCTLAVLGVTSSACNPTCNTLDQVTGSYV